MTIPYNRPDVLDGHTEKINAPCGSVFAIFNTDNNTLKEIGIIKGKAGCCDNLLLRVISLLLSKLLQSNLSREEIRDFLEKQFEGNCGNNTLWVNGLMYHSCIDYIFKRVIEDMISRGEIALEEKKEEVKD